MNKFQIGDKVFVFDNQLIEKTVSVIHIDKRGVSYNFKEDDYWWGITIREENCFVSKEDFINSIK